MFQIDGKVGQPYFGAELMGFTWKDHFSKWELSSSRERIYRDDTYKMHDLEVETVWHKNLQAGLW